MINIIIGAPRSGTTYLWTLLENYKDVMPLTIETIDKTEKPTKYKTSESGVFFKKQFNLVKKFIKNNDDKILIEKTPLHALVYDTIPKEFIKNTILLYRNPIDIVTSMYFSTVPETFKSYDLNRSIFETKKYYKELIKIHDKADIIIKYEDIASNIKNIKPVLDLLNIDDYEYEFKEQIKIAKRKNKNVLKEYELKLVKQRLADEIKYWENL